MASEGYITYATIQAMEGKNSVQKTPVKLNQHSGKESHFALAFSDQNWGSATRFLAERVKQHTADEIATIVQTAQDTPLTFAASKHNAGSSESGPSTSAKNPYCNICKSADPPKMFLMNFLESLCFVCNTILCSASFVIIPVRFITTPF